MTFYECRKCKQKLNRNNIQMYEDVVRNEHKESLWSKETLDRRAFWIRIIVKFRLMHECVE